VLLGGLAWWLRSGLPVTPTARQQAAVFLLVVPLALSSLNNAQPNPLVTGLLLAAAAGAVTERWSAAALCAALATAVKVYPLAVGLLLAAVYPRRFLPRLVLALAVLAALPFLCQRFGYVAAQYAAWYERLREGDESRKYWPLHMAYRDLWLLFRLAHVPISSRGYVGVQLLSAGGCALLCLAARWRGWPRRTLLLAVLTLGSCWMTLCGPATESCTYVLLAPTLAWGLVRAEPRPSGSGAAPPLPDGRGSAGSVGSVVAYGLLLVSVLAGAFGRAAAQRVHALGLQPLGALAFTAGFSIALSRALAGAAGRTPAGEVSGRARAA
jgi:hypothetical protein